MKQPPLQLALLLSLTFGALCATSACAVNGKKWVHAPDDAEISDECEKEEVENAEGEKEEQCKPRQLVGSGRESME